MEDDRTVIRMPVRSGGQQTGCLLVLAGSSIGKMYRFSGVEDMLLGRSLDANVRLDDDGVSRRHARITRGDDGSIVITDLGSTNGSYVNGERIHVRNLQDGDRIQLGSVTVLKFSYQDAVEERFQQQLYESATRDPLTGAYNRRYFAEQLNKDHSQSRRRGVALSLVLIDVDHFKNINDTHGHPQGDQVLRELANVVAGAIRSEDMFCRVGGEEFALLLRTTELPEAKALAERLRKKVESHEFKDGDRPIPVTVSLGVVVNDAQKHPDPEALVEAADRYLYLAKRNGRNRVCSPDDCGSLDDMETTMVGFG